MAISRMVPNLPNLREMGEKDPGLTDARKRVRSYRNDRNTVSTFLETFKQCGGKLIVDNRNSCVSFVLHDPDGDLYLDIPLEVIN